MSKHRNKKRNYQKKCRPLSKIDKAIYVVYMIISFFAVSETTNFLGNKYMSGFFNESNVAVYGYWEFGYAASIFLLPVIPAMYAIWKMVLKNPLVKVSAQDNKKHPFEYCNVFPILSKRNKHRKKDILKFIASILFSLVLSVGLCFLSLTERFEYTDNYELLQYNFLNHLIDERDYSEISMIKSKANRVFAKESANYKMWLSYEITYNDGKNISLPFDAFKNYNEVKNFHDRLFDKFEGTIGSANIEIIESDSKYTEDEREIINYVFGLSK